VSCCVPNVFCSDRVRLKKGRQQRRDVFCVPKTVLPTDKLVCARRGHEFRLLVERPRVFEMTRHVARNDWVQWLAPVNMLMNHPVREFVEVSDSQLVRLLSGRITFGAGCSTDCIMSREYRKQLSHAQLLHGVGRLCRRRCVL
jgi:hypothetical protein